MKLKMLGVLIRGMSRREAVNDRGQAVAYHSIQVEDVEEDTGDIRVYKIGVSEDVIKVTDLVLKLRGQKVDIDVRAYATKNSYINYQLAGEITLSVPEKAAFPAAPAAASK